MKNLTQTFLDDWWGHNGVYDRIQASGIHVKKDIHDYLNITDSWWFSRALEEKQKVYNEFFEEV